MNYGVEDSHTPTGGDIGDIIPPYIAQGLWGLLLTPSYTEEVVTSAGPDHPGEYKPLVSFSTLPLTSALIAPWQDGRSLSSLLNAQSRIDLL